MEKYRTKALGVREKVSPETIPRESRKTETVLNIEVRHVLAPGYHFFGSKYRDHC